MSFIEASIAILDGVRERTLATCHSIAEAANGDQILGWRPGPGRAHIAWQLMHVGITEDLFATERLANGTTTFPDLKDRFCGGSTPDDTIPSMDEIKDVLATSRERLIDALRTFSDDDLELIPEALKERGWNLAKLLKILIWHEAHHQGQAHLTLNLWNASQDS